MKTYSIKLKAKNKLHKMRAYLCGAMDRVPDGGIGWRKKLAQSLRFKGVVVLDPSNKPTKVGVEDLENRALRKEWKKNKRYDLVAKKMKTIRNIDLRMVDVSDFLIVNLDLDVHPCGTYEELFLANRQKKPIIVRVAQGKENAPDWLLGTIPHEMIFSTWTEVIEYLDDVNGGYKNDPRWIFFKL